MKERINVYGTGENAIRLILENEYLIENVIACENSSIQEFMGYKVIPIDKIDEKQLRSGMILVASSREVYWDIKRKLENTYNLSEFVDFVYYRVYKKQIALAYGNCHMVPMIQALENNKEFNEKYAFYPFPAICDMPGKFDNSIYDEEFMKHISLLLHQCIRENNFYGKEYSSHNIISRLPKSCRIIGVPNLYRTPLFMYPQVDLKIEGVTHEGRNWFPFRDSFIDAVKDTLSIKEIAYAIKNDTGIFKADDIRCGQEKFFKKIRDREQEWDIKPYDFLKENIADNQMFYDTNHPTPYVIRWIITELMSILNIQDKSVDWNRIADLGAFELPIYASVRNACGLKYNPSIIRKKGYKILPINMDIEEYVRQYIKWYEYDCL